MSPRLIEDVAGRPFLISKIEKPEFSRRFAIYCLGSATRNGVNFARISS